jgi:hypothetical protein
LLSVRAILFHSKSIVVIGFAYSDDFPPTKGEDVYGSIADPADIQADESFDLNRSRTIDGSDVNI